MTGGSNGSRADGTQSNGGSAAAMPKDAFARPLPRRFYTTVSVAAPDASGAHAVHLDGRPVRTPRRHALLLPDRRLAERIAEEWRRQTTAIDPSTMPLTTLAATARDIVTGNEAAVIDEITRYAGSDLLCYRADEPPALAALQAEVWDPILDRARDAFGAAFVVARGLMPVTQPGEAPTRLTAGLRTITPLRLAAIHVLTTLTGSAILATAVARQHLTVAAAWQAAHVDEDWQIARWGADAEATARRARRWREAEAAAFVLDLT